MSSAVFLVKVVTLAPLLSKVILCAKKNDPDIVQRGFCMGFLFCFDFL